MQWQKTVKQYKTFVYMVYQTQNLPHPPEYNVSKFKKECNLPYFLMYQVK